VDEAHRLNEKSGLFGNLGTHQVEEIIGSSKCAIFSSTKTNGDVEGHRAEEGHRAAGQASGANLVSLKLRRSSGATGPTGISRGWMTR